MRFADGEMQGSHIIKAALMFLIFLGCAIKPVRAEPGTCLSMPVPRITVTTRAAQPVFDFSMTREMLNQKYAGLTRSAPEVYHLEVNSVMTGVLSASHKAVINQKAIASSGEACLGLTRIDVTLMLSPRIYMASEYRKQECQYKSYLIHELKHVETDKALMLDYKPRIGQGILFAFSTPADFMIGPVKASDIKAAEAMLQERVQGVIDGLYTHMMQERLERQKRIDTMGEYASLSNAC